MKMKWSSILFAFAVLSLSTYSSATTLAKMDFEDMVKAASACVVAEAMDVTYTQEQGGMVTLTTFKVMDTAFGDTDKTITVRTAGGMRSNSKIQMTEVVAGAPRFFKNAQSMLLLSEHGNSGHFNIVGVSQGVFPVANAVVSLPESMGANVSIDDAISLINERRNTDSNSKISQ
ncbi:hypothetical protein ISG33_08910 [Glaciecola sp. MH2013]|uniref:hypothetical protein n=1 Tax=Glaciecola sp. MH2013 TaxID=2785524 RepID=UPI00189FDFCF|nr:hypothetical protein [Glaciecola sp. MH2013]MBF7073513.1 hypothetical protein [Glaciecola sp. MH2013]